MPHRFFVESPIASNRATLAGSEAHHVQHVMRMHVGDELLLFDGGGSEFRGRIESMGRQQVEVTVLQRHEHNVELAAELTVGAALPKADRQRWLVEKLTELGTTRFVPLRTRRSVVHPDDKSLNKLRRAVIEASKQCGRNRLLHVTPLTSLDAFLATAPDDAQKWFGHAQGSAANTDRSDQPLYVAVGPEGGLADEEIGAARQQGWRAVSLGPRILRIETACLALATLAAQRFFR